MAETLPHVVTVDSISEVLGRIFASWWLNPVVSVVVSVCFLICLCPFRVEGT